MLLRGIPQRNASARRGVWVKSAAGSYEVRGKCLGIVGYGHIGTQIGLLGAPQLERMKPGAHLINASRGTIEDIHALVDALKSQHLAGAGMEVFPMSPKQPGTSSFRPGMDNVLLTPHVGGSTEEAQQNIGLEVAEKLIKYSDNGSTISAVNFPEVALPEHPGQRRLLHIHRNQPGVPSAINAVFSGEKINIAGQNLQTNAKIGHVVIDVETGERAASLNVKHKLEEVPGTIRTRILY